MGGFYGNLPRVEDLRGCDVRKERSVKVHASESVIERRGSLSKPTPQQKQHKTKKNNPSYLEKKNV